MQSEQSNLSTVPSAVKQETAAGFTIYQTWQFQDFGILNSPSSFDCY